MAWTSGSAKHRQPRLVTAEGNFGYAFEDFHLNAGTASQLTQKSQHHSSARLPPRRPVPGPLARTHLLRRHGPEEFFSGLGQSAPVVHDLGSRGKPQSRQETVKEVLRGQGSGRFGNELSLFGGIQGRAEEFAFRPEATTVAHSRQVRGKTRQGMPRNPFSLAHCSRLNPSTTTCGYLPGPRPRADGACRRGREKPRR